MKSFRAQHNLIAVSANNRETAVNTEQTLDTSMLVALSDVLDLEPRRESNAEELTGKEEPDTVYDMGALSIGSFNFEKAQPQHFAFLLAYGLGSVSTVAAGSTGYKHTITPIVGDLDVYRSNPTFTAAQRYGKTIGKRLFGSYCVDAVSAKFEADSFCGISGTLKGTGKYTDSVYEESITENDDSTTLTLAANGVEGSSAQDRLDSIHRIRAELASGVWTEVEFTAVSSATPAVITITPPGSSSIAVTYKVLYTPSESGWMSFPSRAVESPLRVAQMQLTIGGTWNGSAFEGGRSLSAEVRAVEYSLSNNMQTEFTPGGSDSYASRVWRDGRTQTLKLDRELREWIVQNAIIQNETFGMKILTQGNTYESGYNYEVGLVLPRLQVLKAPISVDGKRLAEAGDMIVLQDDTYGSAIAWVQNKVATYAA